MVIPTGARRRIVAAVHQSADAEIDTSHEEGSSGEDSQSPQPKRRRHSFYHSYQQQVVSTGG